MMFMRRASRALIVTLGLVACEQSAHAQALGNITGVVTDSAGTPIANVEVSIFGAPGTRTDDLGRFKISAPVGLVSLTARRIGYQPATRQFQLNGGSQAKEVGIEMNALPSVLKPVVVRTSKVDYTGRLAGYYKRLESQNSGYFISRDVIDRENPRTLSQLLTHVPAVNTKSMRAGGTGVRMRGRQCWPLVWLDGLQMGAGEVDLDAFPPSTIQGIELYLGSTTAPMRYIANRDQSSCGTILLWSRGPDTDPVTKPGHPRFDLERMVAQLTIYTADQVEKPAAPDPSFPMDIDYPPGIFAAGNGGSVVAEFVVDSAGRVEEGTFGIVSSTDPVLSEAVKRAVEPAIYIPARLKGSKVRQLVIQPFTFPAREKKKNRG
jgi:TonB family protein